MNDIIDDDLLNELKQVVDSYQKGKVNFSFEELAFYFNLLAEMELFSNTKTKFSNPEYSGLKEQLLIYLLRSIPLNLVGHNVFPAEIVLNKVFSDKYTSIVIGNASKKINNHPEILTEVLLAIGSNKDEEVVSRLHFINKKGIEKIETDEQVISACMKILVANFYRLSSEFRNGRYEELKRLGLKEDEVLLLKNVERQLVLNIFDSLIKKWLYTDFKTDKPLLKNHSIRNLLYYIASAVNYWPVNNLELKTELAIQLAKVLQNNVEEILNNDKLIREKPSALNLLVTHYLLLLNEIQELIKAIRLSNSNSQIVLDYLETQYKQFFDKNTVLLNNPTVAKVIANEANLRGVNFQFIKNISNKSNQNHRIT
ncbi:MAG: hypothetical protein N3E37_01385 [Candidatus Micrarchaeota archaeon]|nr:hypothetical protein [Candidatus Micrarchaeota archaeon]